MRLSRPLSTLVSLALVAAAHVVGAAVLTSGPANAAESVPTRVTMTVSPTGKLAYNDKFSIGGSVIGRSASGRERAVPVGSATLQRQLKGSRTWTTAQVDTSAGNYSFYPVTAKANATYRVLYSGGTYSDYDFQPSNASRAVAVSRDLHDKAVKRGGRLLLKGKVAPTWKNKAVVVERRLCEKPRCGWKTYSKVRTNRYNRFTARISAPRGGSWFYRAKVKGTTQYVTSYIATYRAYSY